jgi:hypothetical protein
MLCGFPRRPPAALVAAGWNGSSYPILVRHSSSRRLEPLYSINTNYYADAGRRKYLKGIDFMNFISILRASTRLCLGLPVILALSVLHPSCKADTPGPVPAAFQDLYTELDNDISSFNATLGSSSTYPVLYTGTLTTANGNAGPQMLNPNYLAGVQLELQGLQAMGFKAVMFELPFTVLYRPFYTFIGNEAEYEQFVNMYKAVASMIRAAGMQMVIENDTAWASGIWSNWPELTSYYASLDWTQYQQARAQSAQVVAQVMHPDYLVLLEEPDTEAGNTGQSQVNTVSGATDMVRLMLTGLEQQGITGGGRHGQLVFAIPGPYTESGGTSPELHRHARLPDQQRRSEQCPDHRKYGGRGRQAYHDDGMLAV